MRPLGVAANAALPPALLDTTDPLQIGPLGPVDGLITFSGVNIVMVLIPFDILLIAAILWAAFRGRRVTRMSLRGLLPASRRDRELGSAPAIP